MDMNKIKIPSSLPFVFAALLLIISCSSVEKRSNIHPARGGDLNYRDLMIRDYEQMQKAVRKHVSTAQSELAKADEDPSMEASAFVHLRRALRLIFSRPDSDNIVAKLVPEVRRELAMYNAYQRIIDDLAREGIQAFDKDLGTNTVTLSTYAFMLQNLLGEIQGEARDNKDLLATIRLVADANLKLPADVINERKLAGMFNSESPSDQAKRILKKIQPPSQK